MRPSIPCVILLLLAPAAFAQPLLDAVKAHNLEKVRTIIASSADVNQRGPGGATPLLFAARTGDAAICKELLDHGADPNARGDSTPTPLMEASYRGSYDIVDYLLRKGADVNICARMTEEPNGEPLSNARLVLSGPSPRIDSVEKSALLLAVEGGHMSVVRLLLNRGADVNRQAGWFVTISGTPHVLKGRSALMDAAQQKFSALVQLLLEKKADVRVQEQATAMSRLSHSPESPDEMDLAGRLLFLKHATALHVAAEVSDIKTATLLLEAGADLEAKDGINSTPLIAAIRNGCTPVAELLIGRGANVNAEKNTPSSPLILAAERGKLRLVELLLKAGASIDQKAGEKRAPLLSWAVTGGNRQVVRVLLEHGADVNGVASDNSTALMVAAEEGEANIVKFLIGWKAKVDAKDDEGRTALIIASKKGRGNCVQALLLGGADDTIRDKSGKSALAYAMLEGDQRVARLLREGSSAAAGKQSIESERLSDLMEYLSMQIDEHYYSESQYLAFAKPYGKWDVRPLHVASFPHPEGEGTIGPAELPGFVWEVIAHHDYYLPVNTAQNIRNEFIKEGFAHKQRYCENFYRSRRAAFLSLCLQAGQSPRSIFVQQRELTRGDAYERVDDVYRQNGGYWRYEVSRGSPFQMSPRVEALRGYRYTSGDESILQGLFGAGCYCMVKVNGYIVFMTGGLLDSSIGFIYGKTRPGRNSLGPLFNLTLVEDLGDGFYYYVSH